jgi:hypothetical protein
MLDSQLQGGFSNIISLFDLTPMDILRISKEEQEAGTKENLPSNMLAVQNLEVINAAEADYEGGRLTQNDLVNPKSHQIQGIISLMEEGGERKTMFLEQSHLGARYSSGSLLRAGALQQIP